MKLLPVGGGWVQCGQGDGKVAYTTSATVLHLGVKSWLVWLHSSLSPLWKSYHNVISAYHLPEVLPVTAFRFHNIHRWGRVILTQVNWILQAREESLVFTLAWALSVSAAISSSQGCSSFVQTELCRTCTGHRWVDEHWSRVLSFLLIP